MGWWKSIVQTRKLIDCKMCPSGYHGWCPSPYSPCLVHSYRNDPQIFAKLAQQCAQLSITESYLFDHFPDNNMIKFSPLSEAKFGKLSARNKVD